MRMFVPKYCRLKYIFRHGNDGFTRVEMFFTCIALFFAMGLFLPLLARARETARSDMCRQHVAQIGAALGAYRQNNNGYFPFVRVPEGSYGPNCMASIVLLYPDYLTTAYTFYCPSTENDPKFGLGLHEHDKTDFASVPILWESSYGYDCRISPRIDGRHAVLADMDGTYMSGGHTMTMNHVGGQNVLYADGSVKWFKINYVSNASLDNIFSEDAWDADTDSFVMDNKGRRLSRWDHPTDEDPQMTPLTISYDGYPDLHSDE